MERRVRAHKINEYLAGLHAVRWPDELFDLTDPIERRLAVRFIENLLDSL